MLGFEFAFEAHICCSLAFSCLADGPQKGFLIPLPCASYCSLIKETSSFAIF
jgi:hypothetical protein